VLKVHVNTRLGSRARPGEGGQEAANSVGSRLTMHNTWKCATCHLKFWQ
jgi:hypothetical protein